MGGGDWKKNLNIYLLAIISTLCLVLINSGEQLWKYPFALIFQKWLYIKRQTAQGI